MLNKETIIKLAEQHGFKVGRDAGGEYVAPKYEDAVGSLVALVKAAYAMGKETQQAKPVALTNEQIEELWWGELDNRSLGCIRNIIAAAQPPAVAGALQDETVSKIRVLVTAGSQIEDEAEEFDGWDGLEVAIGINSWHEFTEALGAARAIITAEQKGGE